jgi:Protein of unknown function (DUF1580)
MITTKTKPVQSSRTKTAQSRDAMQTRSIDSQALKTMKPLCDAIEEACGVRPTAQCAAKWSSRGVRGIKIPTVLIGGRRYAAIDDAKAFLNKINGKQVLSN